MNRPLTRLTLLVTSAALIVVGAVVGAAPARAAIGGGNETNTGYSATVHVTLTGDVSPSLVASVPSPPPLCWWAPIPGIDSTDPTAVQTYLASLFTGSSTENMLVTLPSEAYIKEVIAQVAAGHPMTFYRLNTADGYITHPNDPHIKDVAKACHAPLSGYTGNLGGQFAMTVDYQAYPPGQQPQPAPNPEALAKYAYKVMDLVEPALDWNPKSTAVGGASLVNLPTWLWTRDPEAVANRQVVASAGGVTVTVDASTTGMTVTSPVQSTQCSAAQARTRYAADVSETAACIIAFPSASTAYPAGFPVAADTTWGAVWTSNQGPGGQLGVRDANAVTNIPVAEVQTTVTGSR